MTQPGPWTQCPAAASLSGSVKPMGQWLHRLLVQSLCLKLIDRRVGSNARFYVSNVSICLVSLDHTIVTYLFFAGPRDFCRRSPWCEIISSNVHRTSVLGQAGGQGESDESDESDELLLIKVNPGLNPKRLFNCEGTIKKYQMMIIGGVPPLIDKPWFINPELTLL